MSCENRLEFAGTEANHREYFGSAIVAQSATAVPAALIPRTDTLPSAPKEGITFVAGALFGNRLLVAAQLPHLWDIKAPSALLHSSPSSTGAKMRYSAFEQAAVEASAGVKEIDAEMSRLKVKRELLQTLVHQLLSVLPANTEPIPADGGNRAGTAPDHPVAEQPSYANGMGEGQPYSNGQEEAPASSAAGTAPDASAAEQPSYADLLAQGKPYSLRNEGWPSSSSVDQRGIRQLL